MSLTEEEIINIQTQLNELKVEHRDLDAVITHVDPGNADDLLLRRLKKRKLQLKDRILALEKLLVPDILA